MTRKLGGFATALGVSALLFAALIVALAARAPSAVSPEAARETAIAKPAPIPERLISTKKRRHSSKFRTPLWTGGAAIGSASGQQSGTSATAL